MIRMEYKYVLRLHRMMTAFIGGGEGVRDAGMLESALAAPFAGFGGAERYPSLEEKAARLGYGLVANHPFVDGNKRIGLLAMLTFLEVNCLKLVCSDDELVAAGLGLAAGEWDYERLLHWVRCHTEH